MGIERDGLTVNSSPGNAPSAITVGADGAVRGRFVSRTDVRTYYRALASGQLPADAELDEWRDWLLGTSAANVAVFVLGGPFVGFGLASSVVSPSAYHWLATAAFGVLCVGCVAAFCTQCCPSPQSLSQRQDDGRHEPGCVQMELV